MFYSRSLVFTECFVRSSWELGPLVLGSWIRNQFDSVQHKFWKNHRRNDIQTVLYSREETAGNVRILLAASATLYSHPKMLMRLAVLKTSVTSDWEILVSPSSSTSKTNHDFRSWWDITSTSRTVRRYFENENGCVGQKGSQNQK